MTDPVYSEKEGQVDDLKSAEAKVAEARQKRVETINAKMPKVDSIAERVRAYHPHAADSDVAMQAMLDDFDRLVNEEAQIAKDKSRDNIQRTTG